MNQFLKYACVGGLASIADIAVFSVCVNVLGIHYLVSNTFSFTVGLIINYLLSSKWVFEMKPYNLADFFMFSAIGLIGVTLSNILLYVLIDFKVLNLLLMTSEESLLKPSAKLLVMCIVLLWNFAARKKLVHHV